MDPAFEAALLDVLDCQAALTLALQSEDDELKYDRVQAADACLRLAEKRIRTVFENK